MAEDKELARGFARGWAPLDVNVIAAGLLANQGDADVSFAPLGGDEFGAAVGGEFFRAGRFSECEFAQGAQHLGKPRAECLQKRLGILEEFGHAVMLTIERCFGNLCC